MRGCRPLPPRSCQRWQPPAAISARAQDGKVVAAVHDVTITRSQLSPIKEKWAVREVGKGAVRSHAPARHLRRLLLVLGASDFGTRVESGIRRRWLGRLANTQLLYVDRRGGRRPIHVGEFCGWPICSHLGGWRLEIDTPSKQQQGQRRAHIEKVFDEWHRANKTG